jgi:hypothetical protein
MYGRFVAFDGENAANYRLKHASKKIVRDYQP